MASPKPKKSNMPAKKRKTTQVSKSSKKGSKPKTKRQTRNEAALAAAKKAVNPRRKK